jgi:hypothetical protein
MPEIVCPGCGNTTVVEHMGRDANEFCRVCDYPLFWARSSATTAADTGDGGAGLRRLPGTGGRVLVAGFPCPSCTEPNLVTATVCIRCGSDLHPEPEPPPPPPTVFIPEPEPEPEPPPPPPARSWWPIIIATLLIVGLALLALLLL